MKAYYYLFGSLGFFVNTITNRQCSDSKSPPILHSKTNRPYTIKVGDYIAEVQENFTTYFVVIGVTKKLTGPSQNVLSIVPEHRIPPAVRTYMLLTTAGLSFN